MKENLEKKYKERPHCSNSQKRNLDNKEMPREKLLKSENTVNSSSSLGSGKLERET